MEQANGIFKESCQDNIYYWFGDGANTSRSGIYEPSDLTLSAT